MKQKPERSSARRVLAQLVPVNRSKKKKKKKKSTDSESMIFIQPEQNMRHSFVPSSVQVKQYIHNKRFNYPETGPFIAMQWLRVTGLKLET